MNASLRTMTLVSVLVVLGACSHHHHVVSLPYSATTSRDTQSFVRDLHAGMRQMIDDMHAPGYTGNPDVDFLAMMIPHHQGAVEMSRLALIHGKDPLTRRLAEEIIASQTAEIAAMKQRLAILRHAEDPNPGGFPALHGTRGAAPR